MKSHRIIPLLSAASPPPERRGTPDADLREKHRPPASSSSLYHPVTFFSSGFAIHASIPRPPLPGLRCSSLQRQWDEVSHRQRFVRPEVPPPPAIHEAVTEKNTPLETSLRGVPPDLGTGQLPLPPPIYKGSSICNLPGEVTRLGIHILRSSRIPPVEVYPSLLFEFFFLQSLLALPP